MHRAITALREIEAIKAKVAHTMPDSPQLTGWASYAQCNEDGIIRECLHRLGRTCKLTRTVVEIGCSNGLENNSHQLILDGFRGVWLDGSEECISSIEQGLVDYPKSHRPSLKWLRQALEQSHSHTSGYFIAQVPSLDPFVYFTGENEPESVTTSALNSLWMQLCQGQKHLLELGSNTAWHSLLASKATSASCALEIVLATNTSAELFNRNLALLSPQPQIKIHTSGKSPDSLYDPSTPEKWPERVRCGPDANSCWVLPRAKRLLDGGWRATWFFELSPTELNHQLAALETLHELNYSIYGFNNSGQSQRLHRCLVRKCKS